MAYLRIANRRQIRIDPRSLNSSLPTKALLIFTIVVTVSKTVTPNVTLAGTESSSSQNDTVLTETSINEGM
jgi:hypothetical protein